MIIGDKKKFAVEIIVDKVEEGYRVFGYMTIWIDNKSLGYLDEYFIFAHTLPILKNILNHDEHIAYGPLKDLTAEQTVKMLEHSMDNEEDSPYFTAKEAELSFMCFDLGEPFFGQLIFNIKHKENIIFLWKDPFKEEYHKYAVSRGLFHEVMNESIEYLNSHLPISKK